MKRHEHDKQQTRTVHTAHIETTTETKLAQKEFCEFASHFNEIHTVARQAEPSQAKSKPS